MRAFALFRLHSPLAAVFLLINFLPFNMGLASTIYAERVDNFTLLDQHGKAFELYYHKDATAIVLFIQGNGCPVSRIALPDLKEIRADYEGENIQFAMLNANLQDNRLSIAKESKKWNIDFPVLVDETQLVGESLGLIRTAEVLVINPENWELVYRGPVNDRIGYERQRQEADEHYLRDALDNLIANTPVETAKRETIGCLINFPSRNLDHTQISYTNTIAPMLQEHCVSCHREGGIGPWQMTSYQMIQGFAPMIREVVRTKRMPPWHADPHVGEWANDISLSVQQKRTLIHWIEAGAPRGEGEDPLALADNAWQDWPLGKPDAIIDIPAYTVPASGVVDYQFPSVANPLNKDVWVRAATIVPGDRTVVHHVLSGTTPKVLPKGQEFDSVFDNYLFGYAPGAESYEMPEGTGVFIPQGGEFLFQLHYTPTGIETVDRSRLALYFSDKKPKQFLRNLVVLDPTIKIPANEAAHPETAYFEFAQDAVIHSVLPHSHYRGRASTFELITPDGKRELLLSVPNYDFNWQRGYEFVNPVQVPAGSRLLHTTVYDNSSNNPGNPNPNRQIPWGLQSWDEMLYGNVQFTWADETSDKPTHNAGLVEMYQWIGFLDQDIDGKLDWSELPRDIKKQLKKPEGLKTVDLNQDGGLDIEELIAMRKAQREARNKNSSKNTSSNNTPSSNKKGGESAR